MIMGHFLIVFLFNFMWCIFWQPNLKTWPITTTTCLENKTIHKYLMACLMVVLCGYFFELHMPLIYYVCLKYLLTYTFFENTVGVFDVYHRSRTKLNHFICIVQHQKDWERSYRNNYRTIVANLQLWQVFVYIVSKLIEVICQ